MTSPSRKKRPTTPPSSRPRTSREQGAGSRELETLICNLQLSFCNLQFLLCLGACFLTLAIAMPVAAATTHLQWRSERTIAQKPANSIPKTTSSSTASSTSLRFVRPQTSLQNADHALRLASFDEEAPRLTSGRDAELQTRSVVVNRDDSAGTIRSAQLPPADMGAGSTGSIDTGSQPSDGLRTPFGDNPEQQPQLETPQLDTPPLPEDNTIPPLPQENTTLPPPSKSTLQFDQQQQRQPAESQPTRGQFQPVLPPGPTEPEQSPLAVPTPPTAEVEAEGVKAKESCSKSLENLRVYTVDKVNLSISIKGTEGEDYPFECSIDDGTQHVGRCWEQTTYMWKASALCHKPLYFEDEQLERYGHSFSPCFQPFISGAHFFCTLPVLPYCMGVEPPCECIYALGHYRPGSCAPYMCNPVPLSLRGALIEGGVVTGVSAALP